MTTSKKKEGKTTNEKLVSLHPIEFEEAVRDLLTIKLPKRSKDSFSKRSADKKKSNG